MFERTKVDNPTQPVGQLAGRIRGLPPRQHAAEHGRLRKSCVLGDAGGVVGDAASAEAGYLGRPRIPKGA